MLRTPRASSQYSFAIGVWTECAICAWLKNRSIINSDFNLGYIILLFVKEVTVGVVT